MIGLDNDFGVGNENSDLDLTVKDLEIFFLIFIVEFLIIFEESLCSRDNLWFIYRPNIA